MGVDCAVSHPQIFFLRHNGELSEVCLEVLNVATNPVLFGFVISCEDEGYGGHDVTAKSVVNNTESAVKLAFTVFNVGEGHLPLCAVEGEISGVVIHQNPFAS